MLCNSQCVVLRKSCYRENTQFSALVLKFSIFCFLNQVSFSDPDYHQLVPFTSDFN